VESIVFEEEIGKFYSIKLTLKSGPELGTAYYLLRHGGIFQLSMGYYNELVKKMGLAFLVGIEPNFSQQTVTITFADYLRAMAIGEKDRVLTGKTLEQAVSIIVGDYAPLEMGTIDNGGVILSETISQSKRTDFQLLQDIAKSFAMNWRLDATETPGIWAISLKEINFDDDPDQYETMYAYPDKEYQEITQNIHLKTFKPKSNILGDIPSNVTIESNNPNQPIEVNSKVYNEDRYVSEARGSEIVYTVFGQVNRVQFHENVTDEEAAQIISDQMLQSEELKFVQAKNVQLSEGNAGVRIGQRRHIVPKGIPLFSKVFEGDYLVTRTKHQINTKSGYDTWIDVNRESLTLPPPPEIGLSGGGGSPVIITFDPTLGVNGEFYGWRVSFPEGVFSRGAFLTDSEIRANAHWMDQMNAQMVWVPTGESGTGGFVATVPTQESMQLAVYGWYGNGLTARIDWPDQWRSDPLAENVRQPSTIDTVEFNLFGVSTPFEELSEEELAILEQEALANQAALDQSEAPEPQQIYPIISTGGG